MTQPLSEVINLERYALGHDSFRSECKNTLDTQGVLVLPDFLTRSAIASIKREGEENQHLAYYTANNHNIYLKPVNREYPPHHTRNREVVSSKGCITTDQIPANSALHRLYNALDFLQFLCAVLDEPELHEYADTMSSINLHYAGEGQELGWHFDNSSFAITLLIQSPEGGGEFEYVKDVRDANNGEMNYELSRKILDDEVPIEILAMDPGALVLFRGRNSMHRVTPARGEHPRMLAVLAYNSEPGISLSKSARMTFYGRSG